MKITINGDQGEKFNPPLRGVEFINSAGIDVLITVNSSACPLRLRHGGLMKLIVPIYEYSARRDIEALARKRKEHELLMQLSPTYRAMQAG